jgi:cell division septal protein FtsQ
VSGLVRRRRSVRKTLVRGLALTSLLVITATLATALQVRRVRVTGTHRFPATEVEQALESALGSPTLTARPEALRAAARDLPWVADARVRVSLDGVVSCAVTERSPVAVAVDGEQRQLVDATGQLLGPAPDGALVLELDGFRLHPEERAIVLAAAARLEAAWGATLTRAARVAPNDVALSFADSDTVVVADPSRPAGVADARRVYGAWIATNGTAPLRLDARVAGRVAVMPAPRPDPEAAEAR